MEGIGHNIVVSIYCLAYNHENYIRDALEGFVMQQTNFQYEVFVHDDASTDHTPDIIREYADKYPDIIKPILQTENQYSKGVRIASTYIFPHMQGKYIAVCEGDDYWCSPDKLQKQVDFLETHLQYSACVHNTKRINCLTGAERKASVYTTEKTIKVEDIIRHWSGVFHTSSLMYRREYYVLPEAFCLKSYGDVPRALYLCLVGDIYYFDDVMSVYRYLSNEDSWSYKHFMAKNDMKDVYNEMLETKVMMEKVDEYTNGKYHELISKVIRKSEFNALEWQGKYKMAYTEYKDVIRCFPLKRRLKSIVAAYIPGVVTLYRNLRKFQYKWRKN